MALTGDRRITAPPTNAPVLDWWHECYDHVFIALHPFFRVPASRGGYKEPVWPENEADFHDRIKNTARPVTWASVHAAVAPHEPREKVYRAIWLLSCCGFQERADVALQQRIKAYCQQQCLFLPEDDGLATILHPVTARFLRTSGVSKVHVFDEFQEHRFDLSVTELDLGRPTFWLPAAVTGHQIWALHAPAPGLLMSWSFDDTYALIAMTDAARNLARPDAFFEGWYANGRTYPDPFNPADFFARDPVT